MHQKRDRTIFPPPLTAHSDGVKQWALDPDTARTLWTVSLELIDQPATQSTDVSHGSQ